MALKDYYLQAEDKYYAFIDWLDKKGLSLYPAIDFIESKNIPSFPVMAIIALLIVAGIAWVLMGILAPQATITFVVTDYDEGSPIENASLTVSFNEQSFVIETDAEGKAVFTFPAGAEVTVVAEKQGYEQATKEFDAKTSIEKAISLSKEIAILSKTIQLMDRQTSSLLQKPVTLNFSCSNPESDFSEQKSTSNGEIELDVPANCGNLLASPVSGFSIENGVINLDDAVPQLLLQEEETETGTISVYVKDVDADSISGATVILMRIEGIEQTEQQMEYTSDSGAAVFSEVPTGKYYIIARDRQGRYADYDSSMINDVKDLTKDSSIEFQAVLEASVAGTIKVLVKDSTTNQPIEGAEVVLKKSNTQRGVEQTDDQGKAIFDVPENLAFDLEINHPGYIIATVSGVSPGESFNQVLLEPATSSNSQALIVEVKDTRGNPIDGVKLVLKKSDGTITGRAKTTGFDGKAEFPSLALETYYVYAAKKGFEGKNSSPITIQAREENKISIVLDIGFGDLEVLVVDDQGEPVQGALVELHNIVSGEREEESLTSLDGITVFNTRADKKVFFRVDAEGFLPYNTSGLSPDPNAKLVKKVTLVKAAPKLEVELLGLFINEEKTFGRTIAAGQSYKAKLLLKIPKDSRFNSAGIHVRTGGSKDGRINIMEEDDLYIKEVAASTLNIKKGTSYSPPTGYAEDSKHLTVGNSKWASVEWKNVSYGVYELEADIQIKGDIPMQSQLQVAYRGWGKTGAYVRSPTDSALGAGEATAKKQALYANADVATYTVGPTNLCDSFFCKSFTIEDIAKNTELRVVSEYPASISNRYKLHFSINSVGERPQTNAELEIGSESDGLLFTNFKIIDALGSASQGVADAYSVTKPVGNIHKGSVVSGYVEFATEKEGSNLLTITIKSDKAPVFDEAININVGAAEQLSIDVIPKEIVPMIDNLVLVRVTDSNSEGLSNAIVTATLDDIIVFSSQTNGEGEASFELEAPAPGQTLKIEASKNGYKSIEMEMQIDDSILLVVPSKISKKLNPMLSEHEFGLLLSNMTVADLKLTEARISSDFRGLVEFFFDGEVEKDIPVNTDSNLFITIKLTDKGMLIEKPETLSGAITFYTKIKDVDRTFVTVVPMEIRIGLGENVDNAECLEITPVEWEIITSSDASKSIEIKLKNQCKVNAEEVLLRKLQVKISGKEKNALGTFKLESSDLPGAATVTIDEDFELIVPNLPAGFEGSIDIEFDPKSGIDSEEGEFDIVFKAINLTTKGEEAIVAKLPTQIFISDLKKCVKVIAPEPMEIQTMPFNLGNSLYNRQNYNPYGFSGYGSYGGQSGYGSYGGGYSGGSMYPYGNFDAPYRTNYFDSRQELSWKYGLGENKFRIENTCTIPVEIDLEADSMIKVEESQFSLEPQNSKDVEVEAGYRMGKFSVKVKARTEGSKDKFTQIETVDVIVKRPDEIDSDCIKLSPTKISLNNFLGKPVAAKIYNYCYDIGVLLEKTDRVIKFRCQLPGTPMNTFNMAASEEQGQTILFQGGGMIPSGESGITQGQYGGQMQGQYGQGSYNYPYGNQQQGMFYPQGQGMVGQGSAMRGYEGDCPLVDAIYIVGERKEGGEEGKTIQTIEYEVKPNLQYRKQLCQGIGDLPFQTLQGLRMTASAAYYRSTVRATAEVRYRGPTGGSDVIYERVMLEDLWGIGETIDECIKNTRSGLCSEKGNPSASAQSCINSGALNLTGRYGGTKGFIPSGLFVGGIARIEPEEQVMNISPSACGARDSLELITRSYTDKSGVVLTFKPISTNCGLFSSVWNVEVTINRMGMGPVQCAKISTTLLAKVKKVNAMGLGASGSSKQVMIPVSVLVAKEGLDETQLNPSKCATLTTDPSGNPLGGPGTIATGPWTGAGKKCEVGETGEVEFNKYGFDKISFDWSAELHDKGYICDEVKGKDKKGTATINTFCDASQFGLELNKKAKEITGKIGDQDATTGWKIKFNENEENVKEALWPKDNIDDFKNTKNLFRWAKVQIKLTDSIEDGKQTHLVFFADEANAEKILINKDAEFTKEGKDKLAQVKGFTFNKENWGAIVDNTVELLKILEDEPEGDAIVVEVERWAGITQWEKEVLKAFGLLESEKYMTLYDFKKMHEAIDAGLKKLSVEERKTAKYVEVEFQEIEIAKVKDRLYEVPIYTPPPVETGVIPTESDPTKSTRGVIKTDFLKKFYANISFQIGVLHKEEMSEELKDKVLKEARNVAGIEGNLAEWYYKNIDFNAFLIKDGYGKEFRADFAKAYDKTVISGFKDWKVAGEGASDSKLKEAGKYPIIVNYSWAVGKEKFTLEFGKVTGLADLDKAFTEKGKSATTAYASNPLFDLPLDAGMRDKAGVGNTGGFDAKGYATNFDGATGGSILGVIAYQGNEAIGFTGFGEALESRNFTYGFRFQETKPGTVVSLSGTSFTFSPSVPAIIEADMTNRGGSEGLLYTLDATKTGANESFATDSLITWNETGPDSLVRPTTAKTILSCNNVNQPYYGFVTDLKENKKVTGIVYLPIGRNFKLLFHCVQGSAMVTAKMNDQAVIRGQRLSAGDSRQSIEIANSTIVRENYTFSKLLEEVKAGKMCITKINKDSLELKWNTTKWVAPKKK